MTDYSVCRHKTHIDMPCAESNATHSQNAFAVALAFAFAFAFAFALALALALALFLVLIFHSEQREEPASSRSCRCSFQAHHNSVISTEAQRSGETCSFPVPLFLSSPQGICFRQTHYIYSGGPFIAHHFAR